ncbi:MAG: ATP-binding cassette domain-containing protein, partial [Balneolales bacterium]
MNHTGFITPNTSPNLKPFNKNGEHISNIRMRTQDLSVHYGTAVGVQNVSLPIYSNKVTALIGPSGCGKTTYLRALNRMHDITRGTTVTGEVLLDDKNIYDSNIDPVTIRRKVGMVFQKPTP